MFDTTTDHGQSRVLHYLVIFGNAERSALSDVPCVRLLVARSTVRDFLASSFFTALLPPSQIEVAGTARSLFVRALVAVLNSTSLPAHIQIFSAVLGAGFSCCLLVAAESFTEVTQDRWAFCQQCALSRRTLQKRQNRHKSHQIRSYST